MNDRPAHNIDALLDAFLEAGNESASSDKLTELINDGVEPLVRSMIRGKLHVSLQDDDERQINQDAIDLASEIKTQIIAKVDGLRTSNGSGHIEHLPAYVKTVTINAANQYLRKKHPNRLRLKNQLRYLLTHDRRFALWNTENADWLCGYRDSQMLETDLYESGDRGQLTDQLRLAFDKTGLSPGHVELVDLVAAVFDHLLKPLRFGVLVSLIYELRQITEPVDVVEDEAYSENSPGYHADFTVRLEQAEFLKALWDEIGRLPLRHRAALLLNLKNNRGDGMITLLPLTGVASIRQIAAMLEFSPEDLARIWNDLPWDDMAIAEHLELTRQQVINLRQSARATLRRRLDHF